jgi:hypothetical protein
LIKEFATNNQALPVMWLLSSCDADESLELENSWILYFLLKGNYLANDHYQDDPLVRELVLKLDKKGIPRYRKY